MVLFCFFWKYCVCVKTSTALTDRSPVDKYTEAWWSEVQTGDKAHVLTISSWVFHLYTAEKHWIRKRHVMYNVQVTDPHLSCLPAHEPSPPGPWRYHWYLRYQTELRNTNRNGMFTIKKNLRCHLGPCHCDKQQNKELRSNTSAAEMWILFVPLTVWWLTPSPGSASGHLQWWPRSGPAPGNHCR